jgi:ubiquinone/menaquinone biosynthesis C-methylase UbiE
MTEQTKTTVQREFGANAAAYVTSAPHAKGASLERLLALTNPQPDWQVLDIATGAGHTAFLFAPHVRQVWATDITPEMLDQARRLATERNVSNLTIEIADAEALPYPAHSFDLVTCRIAPHHFDDPATFICEAARVLKPGGMLAIVDNIVPEGVAGDYVNAFEKLRDPSHVRCLSMAEWSELLGEHGFQIDYGEIVDKGMEFASWAARHDANMQRYLLAMLRQTTGAAAEFLQPALDGPSVTFRLWEAILLARFAPK